jgi:uncharacterized protein YjaG (DUF416 family)
MTYLIYWANEKKDKPMELKSEMKRLQESWQRQLLSLALVDQMAINYALFVEVSGFGDAEVFYNITDLMWQQLLGHKPKVDWSKQREKLEAITPEAAQFDTYGVWPAQDACAALSELLTALDEKDDSALEAVLTIYHSTIAQYLEVMEGGSGNDQHPLFEQAAGYVESLQSLLLQATKTVDAARSVKALVEQQPVSNIGIEK